MKKKISRRGMCAGGAAALGMGLLPADAANLSPYPTQPYDTANGEWKTYGGNLSSWRYSALDQINAGNFNRLRAAWTFHPDNLGPSPDPNLQSTPLMVKGRLYLTAGSRRAAVCLDATTGEMLWKYNIDEGARARNSARPARDAACPIGPTGRRTASSSSPSATR